MDHIILMGLAHLWGIRAFAGGIVETSLLLGVKATKEGASDAKLTAKKVAHYTLLAFAAVAALGMTACVGISVTCGVAGMRVSSRANSAALPAIAGAGATLAYICGQYHAFKWALN